MPRPVDVGRLPQGRGYILEKSAVNDHIVGGYGPGQHHHQRIVQKPQVLDHHVGGYHAPAEEHGDHQEDRKGLPPGEALHRQRIGYEPGEEHRGRRAPRRVENGIPVGPGKPGILEYISVGIQVELHRQQHHLPPGHGSRVAEGYGYDIYHRKQDDQHQQEQSPVYQNISKRNAFLLHRHLHRHFPLPGLPAAPRRCPLTRGCSRSPSC